MTRKAMALFALALVALGVIFSVVDLVDRFSGTTEPLKVAVILASWVVGGAALQVIFLLVSLGLKRRGGVSEDSYAQWIGVVLSLVMAALAAGAWFVHVVDPLAPIAFLVGFLVAWLATGSRGLSSSDGSGGSNDACSGNRA